MNPDSDFRPKNLNNEEADPMGLFTSSPSEAQLENRKHPLVQAGIEVERKISERSKKELVFKGQKLNPDQELIYRAGIRIGKIQDMEPTEGELEKTELDLLIITKLIKFINQEMKRLGIEREFGILPEQVHFFSDELYKNFHPESTDSEIQYGSANHLKGRIEINKEVTLREGVLEYINTILHEMLHLASHWKIFIDEKRGQDITYRSGYLSYGTDYVEDGTHKHFEFFNEGVLQKMAEEIIENHREEVQYLFGISDDEFQKKSQGRQGNVAMVNFLLDRMEHNNGATSQNYWNKLKKGFFTGEMMHLRVFEKNFGKGSLRIIAANDAGFHPDIPQDMPELFQLYISYFVNLDLDSQARTAKTILNNRERKAYFKRLGVSEEKFNKSNRVIDFDAAKQRLNEVTIELQQELDELFKDPEANKEKISDFREYSRRRMDEAVYGVEKPPLETN